MLPTPRLTLRATRGSLALLAICCLSSRPACADPPGGNEEKQEADDSAATGQHGASIDLYGDPLPSGATARLGTLRFRNPDASLRKFLAFPAGSTRYVTGSGSTVRFCDLLTGKTLQKIDLGRRNVQAMACSNDGRMIAALCREIDNRQAYALLVWEAATGDRQATAAWQDQTRSESHRIVFSPDSVNVLTATGLVLRLWDVQAGAELLTYKVKMREVMSLAFSPDGDLIALAGREGLFLWHWLDGETPEPFSDLPRRTSAVAFSPDGRLLATRSSGPDGLRIWDVASRSLDRTLASDQFSYYGDPLAFTSDGRLVTAATSSSGRHSVVLWNVASGQLAARHETGTMCARHLAISPDDRWIGAVGNTESVVKIWSVADGKPVGSEYLGHEDTVFRCHFTPDGRHVLTAGADGTVRVWDAQSGRQLRLMKHDHWVGGLAVSPDGKWIASSSLDDTVALWTCSNGRRIVSLQGHGVNWSLRPVCFTPDSSRLLSWGQDFFLRVRDVRNGQALVKHAIRPTDVELEEADDETVDVTDGRTFYRFHPNSASFTADGRFLVMGVNAAVYIFSVSTGEQLHKIESDDNIVACAAGPNGRVLVTVEQERRPPRSGSVDAPKTRLRVRELPAGTVVRETELNGTVYRRIALSPDGKLVALSARANSGGPSAERGISVWQVDTLRQFARVAPISSSPRPLALSPDNTRLVTGQSPDTLLVWDLRQFLLHDPSRVDSTVRSRN